MEINKLKLQVLKQILETEDIKILEKALEITKKKIPREGWDEAFKLMRESGED